MRAMVLDEPGKPLTERELPDPVPGKGQVLIEVSACAVCRTDLHIFDGELTEPKLPLVPGHMIVGRVAGGGGGAARVADGALGSAPHGRGAGGGGGGGGGGVPGGGPVRGPVAGRPRGPLPLLPLGS